MRHPDEIFGHSDGSRRILFEDGLWCIYTKSEHMTYVIHRCAEVQYALDNDGPWECGSSIRGTEAGCGETAPDSIKTLYILHRWDR